MALNTAQQNVLRLAQQKAAALRAMRADLDQLNILWNGALNYKGAVDQPSLDAIPSFNGITVQQVQDGLFALTSTVLNDINTADTQLAVIASLII